VEEPKSSIILLGNLEVSNDLTHSQIPDTFQRTGDCIDCVVAARRPSSYAMSSYLSSSFHNFRDLLFDFQELLLLIVQLALNFFLHDVGFQ
jgi:hypothetical protein